MRHIKFAACGDPRDLRDLVIHEEQGGLALQKYLNEWTLVHVRSGCRLGEWRGTRTAARRRMQLYLQSEVDFTQHARELVNNRMRNLLYRGLGQVPKPRRWKAPNAPPGGWPDINAAKVER